MNSKIHHFIKDNFSANIKQQTPIFSIKTEGLLKTLYSLILNAHQSWNKLPKTAIQASDISIVSETYIPDHIPYPSIQNQRMWKKTYRFSHRSRSIEIIMAHPVEGIAQARANAFFQDAIYRIYMWIFIATHFAQSKCSSSMTIQLYFTEHLKSLAKTKAEPLDTIHVNTAFTTTCSASTEIFLFRKEEWFKVLIHETFHNLGLDFSSMGEVESNAIVSKIFPVNKDVRLYETYCEMWAEIINVLFVAFLSTARADNRFESVVKKIKTMLAFEGAFSAFQSVKILEHYGLKYDDMTSSHKRHIGSQRYKENTYVLSYYIIKSIFMAHVNDFIEWCVDHNGSSLDFAKTPKNVVDFTQLIRELYKTPKYLELIEAMESWISTKSNDNRDFIMSTLKMTVFG